MGDARVSALQGYQRERRSEMKKTAKRQEGVVTHNINIEPSAWRALRERAPR